MVRDMPGKRTLEWYSNIYVTTPPLTGIRVAGSSRRTLNLPILEFLGVLGDLGGSYIEWILLAAWRFDCSCCFFLRVLGVLCGSRLNQAMR